MRRFSGDNSYHVAWRCTARSGGVRHGKAGHGLQRSVQPLLARWLSGAKAQHGAVWRGSAGLGSARHGMARAAGQRNGLSLRGHCGAKASRAGPGLARLGRVWSGKGGNPHGVTSVSGGNLKATSPRLFSSSNNRKAKCIAMGELAHAAKPKRHHHASFES